MSCQLAFHSSGYSVLHGAVWTVPLRACHRSWALCLGTYAKARSLCVVYKARKSCVLYRLQENSRSVSHHQTIAMSRSPRIPKAPKEGALFREHEKPPNRGIKSPRLWASVNTLRLLSLPPGPVRLHGLRGLLTACHPGLLGRVIYGE